MTSRKDDRDEATAAPRITRRRMLAGVGVVAVAGAAAAWAAGEAARHADAATWSAARGARAAERDWQYQRLLQYLNRTTGGNG